MAGNEGNKQNQDVVVTTSLVTPMVASRPDSHVEMSLEKRKFLCTTIQLQFKSGCEFVVHRCHCCGGISSNSFPNVNQA